MSVAPLAASFFDHESFQDSSGTTKAQSAFFAIRSLCSGVCVEVDHMSFGKQILQHQTFAAKLHSQRVAGLANVTQVCFRARTLDHVSAWEFNLAFRAGCLRRSLSQLLRLLLRRVRSSLSSHNSVGLLQISSISKTGIRHRRCSKVRSLELYRKRLQREEKR